MKKFKSFFKLKSSFLVTIFKVGVLAISTNSSVSIALFNQEKPQNSSTEDQQEQIDYKIFSLVGQSFYHNNFYFEQKKIKNFENYKLSDFCSKIDQKFLQLGWKKSICSQVNWQFDLVSEKTEPLVYWVFENNDPPNDRPNTTLIFGGVHPDEHNPIHMALKIIETINLYPNKFKGTKIIVAPLVNPDGFFSKKTKRINASGVDLNRNLPTLDWSEKYSKKNKKIDPRKFPGYFPNSEQGTKFQTDLIKKFNPNKIVSIHAPLALLDLDFETEDFKKNRDNSKYTSLTKDDLAKILLQTVKNYKVRKFSTYPGSLGNYAGRELKIPTLTLELSSSNPNLSNRFWAHFKQGLFAILNVKLNTKALIAGEQYEY